MQPQILSGLRPVAEEYLRTRLGPRTRRYFKRKRLTSLDCRAEFRNGWLSFRTTRRHGGWYGRAKALRKAIRR